MPPDTDIQITETVAIPPTELHFQFSRSSGPGGQHVNRTASYRFDDLCQYDGRRHE